MFILGFTLVFVMLGAAATSIGQMIPEYKKYLEWVAGAVVIIFGLHLTGIMKIKALYADKRLHSVKGGKSPLGAFVVGFAFAFGWTPCLGPIISAILIMASSAETVTKGDAAVGLFPGPGRAVSADVAFDRPVPEILRPLPPALHTWKFAAGSV